MRTLTVVLLALAASACDGATCTSKRADVSTYESGMHVMYDDSLQVLRGDGWSCARRLTQQSAGGTWTAYTCSRCD